MGSDMDPDRKSMHQVRQNDVDPDPDLQHGFNFISYRLGTKLSSYDNK